MGVVPATEALRVETIFIRHQLRHILFGVLILCSVGKLPGEQNAPRIPGSDLSSEALSFESFPDGKLGPPWRFSSDDLVSLDKEVAHRGSWSVRIERNEHSAGNASAISLRLPVNFTGAALQMRAFIRTQNVSGAVSLWIRQDGDGEQISYRNLGSEAISPTSEWKQYAITVPIDPDAENLVCGLFIAGQGRAWMDDVEILVDGKPLTDAPKKEVAETVLDRDHEFAAKSGIQLNGTLTSVQVSNLETLGKVWGFLKYYHPKIIAGKYHWDFELFRILPVILSASDAATAHDALVGWIDRLGTSDTFELSNPEPFNIVEKPDLAWTEDIDSLGQALSSRLQRVRHEFRSQHSQFYVSILPVGNPLFRHEPTYRAVHFPDAGYQLLGLFRYWNMIQYWYPYRNAGPENWANALKDFIPGFARATSKEEYQEELMKIIARLHDTHAALWSAIEQLPPKGTADLHVRIRFIGSRAFVAKSFASDPSDAQLNRGDEILEIGGRAVSSLIAEWEPYYAASNRPTQLREMAQRMTAGPVGPIRLKIARHEHPMELTLQRTTKGPVDQRARHHDLSGEAFRTLPGRVAYLRLSGVKSTDIPSYLNSAKGASGWIFDLRGYPAEFVVFSLGDHLVKTRSEFARFTACDIDQPGAIEAGGQVALDPASPFYDGKIILLVDETTQSQAEYTAMAFRAAQNCIVMGSKTAGADGNVSRITLPGGESTMISGIGVFYPNNRATQGVGIVPDIEVNPTPYGILENRDEILEAACKQITGKAPSPELIAIEQADD